jgi:hypothetical protein
MNEKFRMHFLEAIKGLSPDVVAAISSGKASDCWLRACSVIAR